MARPLHQLLVKLCDPRGMSPDSPACELTPYDLSCLWRLADHHGVLPAVIRSLRSVTPHAAETLQRDGALARVAQLAAVSAFLQIRATELHVRLSAKGLPAILIKGPVAARRLYRPASLRSYVDIDLLVSRSAWDESRTVMLELGYCPQETRMKHRDGYGQEQWTHPEHPGCSMELHWNLVNSPTIRRSVSVTYEQLSPQIEPASWDRALSPAAMLLVAAVHAATSHAFDKLQHLCDIVQVARGVAGEIDVEMLAEMTRATNAQLAVESALFLAGQTFDDAPSQHLRSCLHLRAGLGSKILNAATDMEGPDGGLVSKLRRRLFREMLKTGRTR